MTTKEQQLDLPLIPSLPPIEMPNTTSILHQTVKNNKPQDSISPSHPSVSSHAHRDTSTTFGSPLFSELAGTSVANGLESLSSTSSHSFIATSTLRRSLSVDSFVKHRQWPETRPATTFTTQPSQSHPQVLSHTEQRHPDNGFSGNTDTPIEQRVRAASQAGPSRSRGTSISTTTADELDTFHPDDISDVDRSEELHGKIRNGKTAVRRAFQPGELTLPSRLQTVSSSPMIGKPPPPIVPDRSSSLSHKLKKQRSLISVRTNSPQSQDLDVTIAVIGTPGCGKSTAIRKGLKSYKVSDATPPALPTASREDGLNYVYRVGRISHSQAQDCLLRVLDADVTNFDLSRSTLLADGAPSIDGVVICYDASQEQSFEHVESVLQTVSRLKVPAIVFACKSDLERKVDPKHAITVLDQYDVGLIEVSTETTGGKQKIRTAFDWLFKAIFSSSPRGDRDSYRNPASPAILSNPPPWDISRASSVTPTASSSMLSMQAAQAQMLSYRQKSTPLPPTPDDIPHTPTIMSRARSTSDLLVEREHHNQCPPPIDSLPQHIPHGTSIDYEQPHSTSVQANGISTIEPNKNGPRESRPPPWMTLEELLDKLLFLAVSDDDPSFISHFLLTYRRFTIPCNIILAMEKRVRALDQPSGDPMFACFAQMRICWLLDHWMKLYPSDFAVPGTAGALSTLIKAIVGKTYLLHYASEFIPFLEHLPSERDKDAAWAVKLDNNGENSSSVERVNGLSTSPTTTTSKILPQSDPLHTVQAPVRERKASLPLSAKVLVQANSPFLPISSEPPEATVKTKLKYLVNVADHVLRLDPGTLSQEITRIECQFFLQIHPRHWLHHVLVPGPKDPEIDTVAKYNHISLHIADWVVSLILCYDKPKTRAKMILYFVSLANRLRTACNYSALRAVVAGINAAAPEGEPCMEIFNQKYPKEQRILQSFDQLLQTTRSHYKYRVALKSTIGPCIPALEVHISDLIKANEGNKDYHQNDPHKIHWAKFNMIGRFVDTITQAQDACRYSQAGVTYNFEENPKVKELLMLHNDHFLMDQELQSLRRTPAPEDEFQDSLMPPPPKSYLRENSMHPRDGTILKRIFFW